MMNPFDIAFEFIKAPYASYDFSEFSDDESYNKVHMLNAQAGILAQDPAVAVDSSFGQYGVGVHGGVHRTQEKENDITGRTEYSGVNYGLPYNRIVTNGKMQTDTLDKLRALGSTADREHGFTVHVKRLSNVYHDGKDWKHDNTGDRGHYQYSISPTESRLNEISNSPLYTRSVEQQKLFHNDVSKRTEEEKMHRDWWNNKESHEKTLLNGSKNPHIFTDKQRQDEDFDIHDVNNHPKSRQDAERIDNNQFNFDFPLGSTMLETARMMGKKGKAGHKYGPFMSQIDYEDMCEALANPIPENLKLVDEILNDAKAKKARQHLEMAARERQFAVPDNGKNEDPINQSDVYREEQRKKEAAEKKEAARVAERRRKSQLRSILGGSRRKGGSKANRQHGLKSEPMDIAMRLLKNDDERKKIEAYFDENHGSRKVIDGVAENDYFGMGYPLTPYTKMSDRQIKLFSQMIFNYGTDGKPTINSYWREPFQEAGQEYATEILMGDGMEHIPDAAYDELIRYHQHYNDAVDALPGGAHPPFGSEDHEAHINLWGGTSSAEKSPLTHPHNTAQQKMAADYPHWEQPEKNDFSEGSFQEHYGIEHENRQFTPQTDDGAWQDNIETGKPMDIAFQLLKERKSPEALAHKLEYDKKYQKTPKRVKYREELNAERRRRGIYGSHNGKDVSHTKGGKLTLENQHDNRARHFKSKGTLR